MVPRKSPLRVVASGEMPLVKSRKLSVTQAAESGSHRDLLVAMRARIAKAVEDPSTPPRDLAALTRRLHELAREIEAIDQAAVEDANENNVTADEDFDAASI